MYIYYITSVVYPHDTGIWMSHLSLFLFVLLLLFVASSFLVVCCCSVVVVVVFFWLFVCFCPTSPSSVSSYSCSSVCPLPLCPKITLIYNTI